MTKNVKKQPQQKPKNKAVRKNRKSLKHRTEAMYTQARAPARKTLKSHFDAYLGPSPAEVRQLALAIAMPHEHPNFRLPTMSNPRSSVITLRNSVSAKCNETSPAFGFDAGDCLIAFFGRGPLLAMIWGIPMLHANLKLIFETTYDAGPFSTNTTTSAQWYLPMRTTNISVANPSIWPLVGAQKWTGYPGSSAGQGSDPIGRYETDRFVFMNATETIAVGLNYGGFGTMTGKVYFTVQKLSANGQREEIQQAAERAVIVTAGVPTTGVDLFYADSPGWYALCLADFLITGGNTVTTPTGPNLEFYVKGAANYGWQSIVLSDVDVLKGGDLNIGRHARLNASSLLITNTSSALNMQGDIMAARVGNQEWFDLTGSALGAKAELFQRPASTGCYTFTEFTQQDEEFVTFTNKFGYPEQELKSEDFVHFIRISNANYVSNPNSFMMIFDHTLEFQNDLPRYPKDVSRKHFTSLVSARQLINSRPDWFYENPLHMKDIYRFLANAGRTVKNAVGRYGPTAMAGLSYVDPAHRPLYGALGTAMRYLN